MRDCSVFSNWISTTSYGAGLISQDRRVSSEIHVTLREGQQLHPDFPLKMDDFSRKGGIDVMHWLLTVTSHNFLVLQWLWMWGKFAVQEKENVLCNKVWTTDNWKWHTSLLCLLCFFLVVVVFFLVLVLVLSLFLLLFFFYLLDFIGVLYANILQHSERKINFTSVFRKCIQRQANFGGYESLKSYVAKEDKN